MNKVRELNFKIQLRPKDFIMIKFTNRQDLVSVHLAKMKHNRPQKLKLNLFLSTLVEIKKVIKVHLELQKKIIKNLNIQLKEERDLKSLLSQIMKK